jgi:hypothetical protein
VNAIKNHGYDLVDTRVLMREARSLNILHFDIADFNLCRGCWQNLSIITTIHLDVAPDFVTGLLASNIAAQNF